MGVTGLWKLIEPAGKPIGIETLEDKVIVIGKIEIYILKSLNCEISKIITEICRYIDLATSSHEGIYG